MKRNLRVVAALVLGAFIALQPVKSYAVEPVTTTIAVALGTGALMGALWGYIFGKSSDSDKKSKRKKDTIADSGGKPEEYPDVISDGLTAIVVHRLQP